MTENKEIFGFQAEVNQLLHLVVHSLYSNKEIFLRELISNASDAEDKLRFYALENNSLYEKDPNLEIIVEVDQNENTIAVKDNGIGMTLEEVKQHLGTIAKSGTREFLAKLTESQKDDTRLIGQFGVGFYSAFVVARKVIVRSRKAGSPSEEGVEWVSEGEGGYSVQTINKRSRGTEVILYLKETENEFLSEWRLRNIIRKYSDHISWPIKMAKIDYEKKESSEPSNYQKEYETVNRAKALWTLPKSEITDSDYCEFYKHIAHDHEDPLIWSHNRVEGKQQYTTLLYIPKHAPFDIANRETKHGLKLYIQRVFILDDAEQFLPQYLRFVKGIVDSSDLPLNVSREILQQNPLIESIRASIIKRVLSMLNTLSKNKDQYATFWKEFGTILKEGIIEDEANKKDIAELIRFTTSKSADENQTISFADYSQKMDKGQEKIYYITAGSFESAKSSPHLEYFIKNDIEVILLYDRIDEWVVSHLEEYGGKKLQSVTKGKLELSESKNKILESELKKIEPEYQPIISKIKSSLGNKVKDVRVSYRMTTSPACLIADEGDIGREMQRLLQAAGQKIPKMEPILEINPDHPIIKSLKSESSNGVIEDWAHLLFEQATLMEGGKLDDPGLFVNRLNKILLQMALNR